MALEGKEFEGKFAGEDGKYSADLDDRGMAVAEISYGRKIADYLKVSGGLKIDLDIVGAVQALAAKKPDNALLKSISEGVARIASRLPPPPAI